MKPRLEKPVNVSHQREDSGSRLKHAVTALSSKKQEPNYDTIKHDDSEKPFDFKAD